MNEIHISQITEHLYLTLVDFQMEWMIG